MWGWVAKAAGWAWAHKNEIAAGIQVWKALRAKRKADQKAEENARDYYKREGTKVVLDAAQVVFNENASPAELRETIFPSAE